MSDDMTRCPEVQRFLQGWQPHLSLLMQPIFQILPDKMSSARLQLTCPPYFSCAMDCGWILTSVSILQEPTHVTKFCLQWLSTLESLEQSLQGSHWLWPDPPTYLASLLPWWLPATKKSKSESRVKLKPLWQSWQHKAFFIPSRQSMAEQKIWMLLLAFLLGSCNCPASKSSSSIKYAYNEKAKHFKQELLDYSCFHWESWSHFCRITMPQQVENGKMLTMYVMLQLHKYTATALWGPLSRMPQ